MWGCGGGGVGGGVCVVGCVGWESLCVQELVIVGKRGKFVMW